MVLKPGSTEISVWAGRQVICHLWLAEMWHTAGLTALDPLGQWQVHSQLGLAGKLSLRTNMLFYLQKRRNKENNFLEILS